MAALHELSAEAQCAALQRREISSTELVAHYLARIERHGAALGAFVTVFAEQAMDAARRADAQAPSGLLHGLPLPLKDLHPTAGFPTSLGSAAIAGWVPEQDGGVVGRLRQAGIILIGKTHAPEFGPCCYTETQLASPALSPYGEGLSASGSSGGAAAAVAAGLAPMAHASDGLGSTRTPASNCGLVGIKPSRGRIPSVLPAWYQLGSEGPVARTVGDAALFLDAVGPIGPGELWRQAPWAVDAHRVAARNPPQGRLRIGLLTDPGSDEATVHADCLQACAEAAQALEAMGHEIVTVQLPPALRIWALMEPLCDVIGVSLSLHVQAQVSEERRSALMPYTRWYIENAEATTGKRYAQSMMRLAAAASAWLKWQSGADVLLTPTSSAPALPSGALRLDDGRASSEAMLRWSAFTPWANLSGAPAISLPVHQTASGLPVGVQLMAMPGQDELLLGLAGALEQVFAWQQRHPQVWSR
ncbi:amidase [Paucibacter sp. M5-1]|uniref:amidase n=1 Tax=Paucibacter sp. M5-1 TaxID=3015998 RepID=UPI0022B93FB4|nr:amidase [Paucibacter sp. M5-1]MCZ7879534.1 amidase [Paucibacter sp. M5-1]